MLRILFITLSLVIAACSGNQNKAFKQSSDQEIQGMIVEGKTTKAEVEQMFGKPTDIDYDKAGREKWTYAYSEASKNPLNFIPVISTIKGQEGTTRKMVVVYEGDIVARYAISQNEEQIKKGVFSK
jgi:hypothetical protein